MVKNNEKTNDESFNEESLHKKETDKEIKEVLDDILNTVVKSLQGEEEKNVLPVIKSCQHLDPRYIPQNNRITEEIDVHGYNVTAKEDFFQAIESSFKYYLYKLGNNGIGAWRQALTVGTLNSAISVRKTKMEVFVINLNVQTLNKWIKKIDEKRLV